ncbi:MAG: phosphotransferase [Prevotella sp.]|nr:phosphotransferase [Prevotella sp.]
MTKELQTLYRQWSGNDAEKTEKLAGAGSNRAYYRLWHKDSGETVIGCVGTSREENHAFITLARHFHEGGLPVPQVLAVSADEMCYLQQDLGARSLFDALQQGRGSGGNYNEEERRLLSDCIRQLPRIQYEGARGLDFSVCYPQPEFDRTNVMFDLNYFKYCYLKATGIDFHELRLEEDFRLMAENLTGKQWDTFMYRDFQARNVMLTPEDRPVFIDFQGGRRGPVYYDLASFLWQASARYPYTLRQELLDIYYEEVAGKYGTKPSREEFGRELMPFVLFRLLQVLGAYGFRGYFERKQHFIDSIPPALDSLRQIIETHDFPYPTLVDVIKRLTKKKLTVRVNSFSYKKGIPQDDSGHGGGYVFDCRGTNNPGRYEQYKKLTGLDQPVIKFLEDDGEILSFLDSVYTLADAHVRRYIERGFTNLMFSFGCTGGQHRSVYSAQHLAEHLHQSFPEIDVLLCHREQGIEQRFLGI